MAQLSRMTRLESRKQDLANATSFFNGQRLTMARQLAGLRKTHLAELIGMSPASVTGWESGAKSPSRPTVAKLALALRIDPKFFAGGFPPNVEKPHFRSLRSTPQVAQEEAEAYGQLVAEISGLLEKVVELPDIVLPDVPVASNGSRTTPEEAARIAREFFEVNPGPIQHVVRLAERAGIVVVFSEPGIAAIDAYSLQTEIRPIIVLNPVKDDYYRQRFDMAHEIGHLIMHQDSEPGGKIEEEEANRFAAEFLMPSREISVDLPTTTAGKGWMKLAELKEYWGVSLAALLYRARTLGVMRDVTYRNAMIRMSQNGWRRVEPGRVSSLELPSMLPRAREVINEAGMGDEQFLSGSGLPLSLYEVITSRSPVAS